MLPGQPVFDGSVPGIELIQYPVGARIIPVRIPAFLQLLPGPIQPGPGFGRPDDKPVSAVLDPSRMFLPAERVGVIPCPESKQEGRQAGVMKWRVHRRESVLVGIEHALHEAPVVPIEEASVQRQFRITCFRFR